MKRKLVITIDAKFGTKFQEKVGIDAIMLMVQGWQEFYSLQHDKNKITYDIKEIHD